MRPVPDVFFTFVARLEQLALTAYCDAGDVWTIGWGHTGPDVHRGLQILPSQARIWLRQDAETAFRRIGEMLTAAAIDKLSANQYAALGSFVFNVGAEKGWALWSLIDAGNLDAVPDQLMRFDKCRLANGRAVEVEGLDRRRAAECDLWREPDAGAT